MLVHHAIACCHDGHSPAHDLPEWVVLRQHRQQNAQGVIDDAAVPAFAARVEVQLARRCLGGSNDVSHSFVRRVGFLGRAVRLSAESLCHDGGCVQKAGREYFHESTADFYVLRGLVQDFTWLCQV